MTFATAAASRFAGKALADFLKMAGTAIGGAAKKSTLNYLTSQQGASGLIGKLAAYPETVSNVAEVVAPLATAGAAVGGATLINKLMQPTGGVYAGSRYALPVQQRTAIGKTPAFTTSQYVPSESPLTNEQMGESLLEQQKFQHQLQLIQARNSAGNYGGSLNPGTLSVGSGVGDIMNQMQQALGSPPIYK